MTDATKIYVNPTGRFVLGGPLAEAVEVLTLDRPLVLVLDDLHWSDVSTLDWLSYVARRRALG